MKIKPDLQYLDKIYHSPGIEPWICQIIKDHISSTQLILDIGCGLGFWGQLIKSYINPNSFVIGIDISLDKLKISKFQSSYDVLICADANFLPFKKDSFSGIISIEVLHFLSNYEEILIYMEEIVKNRGLIVISQPSKIHLKTLQKLNFDVFGNILRGLILVRVSNGEFIPTHELINIFKLFRFLYNLFGLYLINYIIAVKINIKDVMENG